MKQYPNVPHSSKPAFFPILAAILPWSSTPQGGSSVARPAHAPSTLSATASVTPNPLSVTFWPLLGSSLPPQDLCLCSFLCLEAFPSLCWPASSFRSYCRCHYLKRSLALNTAVTSPSTVIHSHHFLCLFFILKTTKNSILMCFKKN